MIGTSLSVEAAPPVKPNAARGTMLGIAGQGWQMVTAFVLYAFLARQLGPSQFGHWRVVLSVLIWFELFVGAGLVKVATKAIAASPGDRPRIARATYLGQALVAVVVFVALVGLADPIAALLGDPSLGPLLRISSLDIPLYALYMVAASILQGTHRFDRQAVALMVYATAKFAAIAVLVAVGFSVPGALIGNALSSVVGLAAAFVPLGRCRRPLVGMRELVGGMLVASVPFLTIALAEGVGQTADLWVVSALATSGAVVGWYAAASVFAEVPTFLMLGLNRVVFPSVSRAAFDNDQAAVKKVAVPAVRLSIIVGILGVALAVSAGSQILAFVYGARYEVAFVPLAILMVAAAGRTVRATCTEVLMASDRGRTALFILGGTVVLELALLVPFVRAWGMVGAAAAAAAGALIGAVAATVALPSLGNRPLLTLLRSIAAGAVAGAALWAVAPSPMALIIVLPVAVVVYIALLWLLREIDATDIKALRDALRLRMARKAH